MTAEIESWHITKNQQRLKPSKTFEIAFQFPLNEVKFINELD